MIQARAEENVITLNIHNSVGESYWKRSDREENCVEDVEDLQKLLNKNKNASRIDVYINSPGGSVSEGISIYNILKRTRAYKRVFIDGFACSIASVIAMAGNSISMPKSSMQMIHNAWTWAAGNANELRKTADDLDKINEVVVNAYMSKFKGTEEELRKLLDNESYLTADECLQYGLCTKIVEDSEDTQSDVEEGLEATTNMFENKLNQLISIKNAIRNLGVETVPSETVKEPTGETVKEDETVNETLKSKVADRNVVKEKVEEFKVTELQKFFNYKPEK
nr:head maturation protease, ClpP-related [uncultured Lachnoclostridium sp.]